MSDVIPPSVRAMADDPQAPTAPLDDFITAMRYDDNWWWRIGCGHHLNLFEAALDRVPGPFPVDCTHPAWTMADECVLCHVRRSIVEAEQDQDADQ